MLAIRNDEELNKLVTATIAMAGVMPFIHKNLEKKKDPKHGGKDGNDGNDEDKGGSLSVDFGAMNKRANRRTKRQNKTKKQNKTTKAKGRSTSGKMPKARQMRHPVLRGTTG
jgi:histone H2A